MTVSERVHDSESVHDSVHDSESVHLLYSTGHNEQSVHGSQ